MNYFYRFKDIPVCAIIFVLLYTVNPLETATAGERILPAYMAASTYFGWKVINSHFSGLPLIFTLKTIVIYVIVKGTVSAMLGFFIMPFTVTYKIIQTVREIKK